MMEMLQKFVIGVVETAGFFPVWPGENFKEMDSTQINFNELFNSVDSFGALLLNRMDNGIFLLVTTVHNVMDVKNIYVGNQE